MVVETGLGAEVQKFVVDVGQVCFFVLWERESRNVVCVFVSGCVCLCMCVYECGVCMYV